MTLKNKIGDDYALVNSYELLIAGLPPLMFTKVTGMEDETEMKDLPDRTKRSSGQSKPFDIECDMPLGHTAEMAAMEAWLQEGRGNISPTFTKSGTMIYKRQSGNIAKTYTMIGMRCYKQKLPDADMGNDGDPALCTWTISVDQKIPA